MTDSEVGPVIAYKLQTRQLCHQFIPTDKLCHSDCEYEFSRPQEQEQSVVMVREQEVADVMSVAKIAGANGTDVSTTPPTAENPTANSLAPVTPRTPSPGPLIQTLTNKTLQVSYTCVTISLRVY